MDVSTWLQRIKVHRHYRGQIAAARTLPARPAVHRSPTQPLPPPLAALLQQEGIDELYGHQAESYDAILAGENVVIATGTASGKSLCYHLPVLSALLADPRARALYVYPAKALAHDQLGNLERMTTAAGLADAARPACYDGDTPTHRRPGIRRNASILLTNPDMLHQGILPYHAKWAAFLGQLRYVVLDEIHTYRGIFGSHVAGVVRRLQRLCRHYGADPQFVCCSATLGNPRDLAERLTSRPMHLVDQDASPRGQRWFVLWNPPWLETETRVSRRSANVEAQALMQALIEAGAGTITFTKARVVAELLYKYVTDALQRRRPDLARKIRPYRGGYLPQERRDIERALFSGELLGVCSTNALELGIDVGALDAALIVGFPGTLCSLWQQAGRAGRRRDESLAIFIAHDDPVDQYLMRNPEFLFARSVEQAIIDPGNPHILAAQLACAARELPLTPADLTDFSPVATGVVEALVEEGRLRGGENRYDYAQAGLPQQETNLRTISDATYAIIDVTDDRNEILGQVDAISAPELVYPEAVYLHQGASYLVRELDQTAHLARVERLDADYYTQPVLADECRVNEQRLTADCLGGQRFFGNVTVRWQTVAFRKFKFQTMELIGQTALDLPAQQIDTAGCWLQPPPPALAAVREADREVWDAMSGVRNLLLVALPTVAMCDRYDIGGVVNSSQFGVMTIILYDRYAGGVGYARHGYESAADLLSLTRDLIAGCECENGCPGCVGPPNLRIAIHHDPDVGYGYKIPDKAATRTLLDAWLAPPP
ncbi:MAG: DEAD/DEAH box helicase [Phycisphaerae bacterium]|jgi:DEAD/DEAH box helicase domain-containing protein